MVHELQSVAWETWYQPSVMFIVMVFSYWRCLLGRDQRIACLVNSLSLYIFAKMALPEQVANIVDPTLLRQRDMGEASSSLNNTHDQSSPRTQTS